MRYNEQLPIKLYDKTFTLQAIIDDYAEISFSHNLYEAGDFSISINYNIPNAQLFQRGLFVQFGNDEYMFGEILSITDTIAQDGKGSQTRTITGKDARFLFKRRVIKNMNSEGSWVMTAKGELCMRNLIADQCGVNAEEKRRLPIINNIPSEADALGASYSVSESFSNLYDTLVTIATQSEIGWRVRFTGDLTLEVYNGTDLSNNVQFSTDFDSLANGTFTDTSESFANTVYVGGKGTGEDRDVYEGEIEGAEGLDRYEAFDNQSGMTTESEYETEALSVLSQYGQTITVNGNGLAKCPYVFKEQYNIGDIITIAFSGKSAKAQILGVTEHWGFGAYGITFSFGKPVNDLNRQLQLILKQIQKASNKTTTTSSVKYYTIPTDTEMPASDVIYDTIGFTGTVGTGATFKLYLDNEKTGAKTYHVYFKQLGGTGKLTLTTGVTGASNLVMNAGTYVAIIYVDNLGNVTMAGATATSTVEAGNTQPVTSDGVNSAISGVVSELDVPSVGGSGKYISAISETDGKISATAGDISGTVTAGDSAPVSGGAVADILSNLPTDAVLHYSFDDLPDYPDGTAVYKKDNDFTDTTGWSGNATATVSNGKITLSGSNNTYMKYNISLSQNHIILIKGIAKVDTTTLLLSVRNNGASSDTTIASISTKAGQSFEIAGVVNANSNGFIFYSNYQWEIEISQIYIGDGSYSTPIIDNANGKWNSISQSGVAVQGVSGKGIYFPNAQKQITVPYRLPTSNDDLTISLWINIPSDYVDDYSAKAVFATGAFERLFGFCRESNTIVFYARDSQNNIRYGFVPTYDVWHSVVTVYNGTSHNFKLYCDGLLLYTSSSNIANYQFGSDSWYIWGNTHRAGQIATNDNQSGYIDDLLIFNRALTEKEVLALYYNKANTPKYYSFADYRLDNM